MSNVFYSAARALRGGDEKTATAAVILAAGKSTRMGKKQNKQLLTVNGIPVLAHTLMAYQKCPHIRQIVVVARQQDFPAIVELRQAYGIKKMTKLVVGGKDRQESARFGVSQVDPEIRFVAIADGARCLTTPEEVSSVCLRAYKFQAASAGHLITSSVKRATNMGMITESVDRDGLWEAQTPQVFHVALYNAAIHKALGDGFEATDDNQLIEHLGYQVKMVECGRDNIKITTPDDLALAKAILTVREKKSK